MSDKIITADGYKKLQEELEELKKRRIAIVKRIESAIQLGDLKENAEYHEAKDDQSFVDGRLMELAMLLKNAQIISSVNNNQVNLGNKVIVELVDEGVKKEYQIVSFNEANPIEGKISNESPLGQALLGHSLNDLIEFNAPKKVVKYKIVEIK